MLKKIGHKADGDQESHKMCDFVFFLEGLAYTFGIVAVGLKITSHLFVALYVCYLICYEYLHKADYA